jgi:hypothetical protein
LALGLTKNTGGRVAAARCEEGDEKDTNDSFVLFVPLAFAPLWRGPVVYMSHRGNDYDTDRKNPKTYGSVLVRFFVRKVHFAPFFWPAENIRLATRTVSVIYRCIKNEPFIGRADFSTGVTFDIFSATC